MFTDSPVPLSDTQRDALAIYAAEVERLNQRVNLIARPATRADVARHVRHCLTLATRRFPDGAVVVDWGSGGGLPAIPLAVAFPKIQVVAVDAVGKKTEAVKLLARRLGLDNLTAWNGRAEAYDGPAPHYSVSRATAPLATLWGWHERVAVPFTDVPDDAWAPGLVCLKGGDLGAEVDALRDAFPQTSGSGSGLSTLLGPDWADKRIVHVTAETTTRPPAEARERVENRG